MRKISTKKGFTLVEMIISLGIFTVVALVAVGALIKVMDANRKSITLKTAINNLNFALESMTREMRVGKNYGCQGGPCQNFTSNANWTLTFDSSKRDTSNTCYLKFAYKYDSAVDKKTLLKAEATDCMSQPVNFYPLISSDIKIEEANVVLDDADQPKIFLYLKGVSGIKEKDKTEFAIQTTISQRLPK